MNTRIICILMCMIINQTYTQKEAIIDRVTQTCINTATRVWNATGAHWLYHWAIKPDHAFAKQVHTLHHIMHYHYFSMTEKLEKYYQIHSFDEQAKQQILQSIDEDILYDLTIHMVAQTDNISDYIHTFDSLLSKLQSAQYKLKQQLEALKKMPLEKIPFKFIQQINTILLHIEAHLKRYYLLQDYLHHHNSYFHLYIIETKLRDYYSQELYALSSSPHKPHYIKHEILLIIQASQKPDALYTKNLDKAMQRIELAIQTSLYHYPERITSVRTLYNTLETISKN